MEEQVRAFLSNLESQPTYSSSTRLAYQNDLRCLLDYLEQTIQRPARLADFSSKRVADFLHRERDS